MAFSLSRLDRLIPRPVAGRLRPLCDHAYAHRGLHGENRTENGQAAFQAALEADHGVELDVMAASDGEPMVFHDARLERLTGRRAALAHLTRGELRLLRLPDGGGLPSLADALAQVAGRVPVLIEVKAPDGHDATLCERVATALDGYEGAVGVMSFDPSVPRWFRRHAPAVTRGLVACNGERSAVHAAARHIAAIRLARPDFLAWDIRDLPDPVPAAARRRGVGVFTWTVRTTAEHARARANADQSIFEVA